MIRPSHARRLTLLATAILVGAGLGSAAAPADPGRHRAGVLAAAGHPQGPDRLEHHAHGQAGRRPDPARRQDQDVDVQRHVPGSDHPPADRPDDDRHPGQQPAARGRRPDAPQPRQPLDAGERRPAGRLPGGDRRRLGDLHVHRQGGRRERAGRHAVVPRPPDGRDRAERLDGPRRHVHHRRPGRPADAAEGRVRRPADADRPLVRREQPAPLQPGGQCRPDRATGSWSTASRSPTSSSATASTGCGSSTPRTRARTTSP